MLGVRTQMMNIKAKAKLASANVLTLEQRKIIIEKKKTRHARREKRRNRLEDRMEDPDDLPPTFPE
jgi:Spy/CpxP family protein refolding chaperone